jgi:alanyl-tRNA synthetase
MKSQELRQSFIDFFVSKQHKRIASATLIPDEMSTTLFTIAGMEQFVPSFLGETPAPAPRVVTVQRCLRVAGAKSDIENVGRTGRHGTFLEMLGNFSFGDYYKREAILWAWEYLTRTLRLDPEKLYVTVHTSDDEAQKFWEAEVGLPSSRITRFDEDNFWTMGPTGPCGPSSEIFYDIGVGNADGPGDTGPNLGKRYVEIWNLVFQQYNRTPDGKLHDLPRKAIDTGAGFERVLAVVNDVATMYETDLFMDLIAAQPSVGHRALSASEQLVRRRIIADHARAATFLIADGVYPSNTDRGYVLRFLVRRAIRQGRLLGYPDGFFTELVPAVVTSLAPAYPELQVVAARVRQAVGNEENSFDRTLERGSEMLRVLIQRACADGANLSGHDVFTLHDTYGFPSELSREIAAEAGVTVDIPGFDAAMREQRERAREDTKRKRVVTSLADVPAQVSIFAGYEGLESVGSVGVILVDGKSVEEISAGAQAQVILDRTSFYAEKGGQIGDQGTITCGDALFDVRDVQCQGEAILHTGTLRAGVLCVGDEVCTSVHPWWRQEIRRHHTSAHLLQRALKDVLGDEVVQAGSWVGIDRMRFDFRSPSGALSPEQRCATIARVNELIREDHHLVTRVMTQAQASASGAISLAGEKYGESVRVVHAGPSIEFCGGTHAVTTGELGMFVLLSEASIGSGIRRIESTVSRAAERYVLEQQALLTSLSETLSVRPVDLGERVERLQNELQGARQMLGEARARLAAADAHTYIERLETVGGKPLVAAVVRGADIDALKVLLNAVRSKVHSGVIAFAGVDGDNVTLFVGASDDLVKQGVHAGNLVKAAAWHVGGRGGGQAAQAQGGGKNPAGAEAALSAIRSALQAAE